MFCTLFLCQRCRSACSAALRPLHSLETPGLGLTWETSSQWHKIFDVVCGRIKFEESLTLGVSLAKAGCALSMRDHHVHVASCMRFRPQAATSRGSVREACGDELCIQGQPLTSVPCSLRGDFSSFNKNATERLSSVLVHHSMEVLNRISPAKVRSYCDGAR